MPLDACRFGGRGPGAGYVPGMRPSQGPTSQAPNPPGSAAQDQGPASPSQRRQEARGRPAAKIRRGECYHDGRLTAEQARAVLIGFVVRHFAEIDKDNRG